MAAPSAQLAAGDRTLEAQGRHEVSGVERTTARQNVNELEIREGEEHREGHHHRDERRQHGKRDEAEALPGCGAVQRRGLVKRGRDRLQAGQQA